MEFHPSETVTRITKKIFASLQGAWKIERECGISRSRLMEEKRSGYSLFAAWTTDVVPPTLHEQPAALKFGNIALH